MSSFRYTHIHVISIYDSYLYVQIHTHLSMYKYIVLQNIVNEMYFLPVSYALPISTRRSNVNFCHMTNQEGMCVGVMKSTVMIKVEDHHIQDFLSTKNINDRDFL